MECPSCSKEMISGNVYLRSSVLGFLFRGTSHSPVWFKPEKGWEYVVLKKHFLPGGDYKPAHRCEHCGTVVFQGEMGL